MDDSSRVLLRVVLDYLPFIVLFSVGWFFGRRHERAHLKDLDLSERTLGHIIVSSERFYQPMMPTGIHPELVVGSVVVGQDYFKMVIAGILNFFGKNLVTYESLLERARREAVVRMKIQAQYMGYNQVYGVRLEITNLNHIGSMVEAIAYGTAVYSINNPKVPPPLPAALTQPFDPA